MLLDGQQILPLSDPGKQSVPGVRALPEHIVPGVPRGTDQETAGTSISTGVRGQGRMQG